MNTSGDTLDDERKGNLALQHTKTKTLSLLNFDNYDDKDNPT
jgi:hypothetical protein